MEKTDHKREKHIPTFSAVKQKSGYLIKIVGYVQMHPTQNPSKDVIGIIELDDQVVPILDFRQEKKSDITDLCCIVILENSIGRTTIMTGRLYESSCQVYELSIEPIERDFVREHSPKKPLFS